MAGLARTATRNFVGKDKQDDMCREVHNSAVDECPRGWMRGSFSLDQLPEGAVLTRRFGVQQSSTMADGTKTIKFRPIDDFSESLINVTNSCDETILPMGIDQICAGLVSRMRCCPGERLLCKTIDLRKACKNLPLSEQCPLGLLHLCAFACIWRT